MEDFFWEEEEKEEDWRERRCFDGVAVGVVMEGGYEYEG